MQSTKSAILTYWLNFRIYYF